MVLDVCTTPARGKAHWAGPVAAWMGVVIGLASMGCATAAAGPVESTRRLVAQADGKDAPQAAAEDAEPAGEGEPAEGAPEGRKAPSPGAGMLQLLLPVIVIMLLFNFIMLRPQKRERAALEQAIKNLKKNDRVLTIGGIFGVVTQVQPDANEVTIRVDETNNTRLRITTSSISRVLGEAPSTEKETS